MLNVASPARIDDSPKMRAALVDELGDLSLKLAAWRPNVNPYLPRANEIEAIILSWYEKQPPEKTFIAEGSRWKIPVTAQRRKRTVINVLKLIRKWGVGHIAELWEPPLNLIEREVPKEQHKLYIQEAHTGPRSLGDPVMIDPPSPSGTAA